MSDFGENRKKDTALTLNFPMFLCKHRMHQDCTKCIQWLHLGMHCHHQSDRREMLCSESYLKCNSGMCVCVHKNAHLQASRAQQLHTQSASAAVRLLRLHWEPMETSSLSLFVSRLPLIFSSNYQTRSKDHALWFGETAGWAWKLFLLSSM